MSKLEYLEAYIEIVEKLNKQLQNELDDVENELDDVETSDSPFGTANKCLSELNAKYAGAGFQLKKKLIGEDLLYTIWNNSSLVC